MSINQPTYFVIGVSPTIGGTAGAILFDSGTFVNESTSLKWDTATSSLLLATNATLLKFGASSDLILGRRGAANLRLGDADAAAPVAQTLSVQSVVTGTSNTAGADFTIAGSTGTGSGGGGSLVFRTSPADSSGSTPNTLQTRLTINGVGNIAFGVTPANWSANGNIDLIGSRTISFSSAVGTIASNAYFNSSWFYKVNGAAARYDQSSGQHIWQYASTGVANAAITWTTTMLMDGSGNLAFGLTATSPWSSYGFLEMETNRAISFKGASADFLQNAYYDGAWKYSTTNLAARYNQSAGVHIWQTAISGSAGSALTWSDRLRIDNNGQVSIGTNSPESGATLTIIGTSVLRSSFAGYYTKNGTGGYVGTLDNNYLFLVVNNVTRVTVTNTGDVEVTGYIKTATPASGTSGNWKLGSYVAGAPAATGYVQIDIGGVAYKLLAAT